MPPVSRRVSAARYCTTALLAREGTAPSGEMIVDKDGPTIIVPKDEVLLPAEVLEVDT